MGKISAMVRSAAIAKFKSSLPGRCKDGKPHNFKAEDFGGGTWDVCCTKCGRRS